MSHATLKIARVNPASIAKAGLMAGAAVLAAGSAQAEVLTFELNEDLALGESFALPGIPGINFLHASSSVASASKLIVNVLAPSEFATNDSQFGFGPGSIIGPGTPFLTDVGITFPSGNPDRGSFYGFSFESEPAVKRYGWVEVSVRPVPGQIVIWGFGYETTPGLGVTTPVPEPDSLALLAAGSLVVAGAAARRRRRSTSGVNS